ncbi:MAG: phosphoribosylformylglycinamidine synthase [Deltaproteobacteria bacterium RIFCSPLOWO2_02_FULL_44_10]|nr:MAG: phosphoribosylformylglycinamidine synthase [Deltaproteobacteria bacterium RIFCSPHIGHO2_02_FULL_44_16]OGQ46777.1 MAG: phosphoribosylformylglycinamidine synthase [Deltaproteobacteria bacterium RIFCSPLOWO2_02_FULL_44_10]
MLAKIYVTLKKGVHDPQGETVQHALSSMGYKEVAGVRVGKYLEVKLNETNRDAAEIKLKEMCEKLLANTVIESYRVEFEN